jgi:L-ribulose-5-phosphate 4-epimerase
MTRYNSLKEACFESNLQLPKLGLVMFTFGNVSVADRKQGVFAIKPSGVPYEKLKPSDMVVIDFENKIVDGRLNPSSDTKTHAFLYKTWPAIQGISHTHSTFAVAWAQAQKDIPILGTTHADHLPCDVPCAPVMSDKMIRGDYEHETGRTIVQCFKNRKLSPEEVEMVLVSKHGPFTWGKTAEKAVYNSAILEELAKMAWLTLQVNPSALKLKNVLIDKHFSRKHGKEAYYGQKKK